jgi:glycine cleavage system H protein
LPVVGDQVEAGEVCGELESTKAVSDLYSPASGTVVAVNDHLVKDPSGVNGDPYDEGWLFELTIHQMPDGLLTAAEYRDLVDP